MWKGLINFIEIMRVMCELLLNDIEIFYEIRDYDLIVYESLGFCVIFVVNIFQFLLEILFVRFYSFLKEKYNIIFEVSYCEVVVSVEFVFFNGYYVVECL